MKLKVYAMFDAVSAVFTRPVFLNTVAEARRGFTAEAVNPESPVGKNPEDYSIYEIGEYDDTNGYIQGMSPQRVYTGLEAVAEHAEKVRRLQKLRGEIAVLEEQPNEVPQAPHGETTD